MIIALDLDGVLNDFVPVLLEQYNHLTNEGVLLEDIRSNKTHKFVEEPFTLKRLKDSPGFLRGLKPVPGAIEVVNYLHAKGHKVLFVSSNTNCPTSGYEKRDWLNYYFCNIWRIAPLVLTTDKSVVRCDALLDDDPKNLCDLQPPTKPLLWTQSYNATVIGYDRIGSWKELVEWVEQ